MPKIFTQEQVTAEIARARQEGAASMQPHVTQAQQRAADAERHAHTLGATIESIRSTGPAEALPQTFAEPVTDEDWSGLDANELQARVKETAARAARMAREGGPPAHDATAAMEARMDDMELSEDRRRLRANNRWLTDQQEALVLQTAQSLEISDLDYALHRTFFQAGDQPGMVANTPTVPPAPGQVYGQQVPGIPTGLQTPGQQPTTEMPAINSAGPPAINQPPRSKEQPYGTGAPLTRGYLVNTDGSVTVPAGQAGYEALEQLAEDMDYDVGLGN